MNTSSDITLLQRLTPVFMVTLFPILTPFDEAMSHMLQFVPILTPSMMLQKGPNLVSEPIFFDCTRAVESI